MNEGPELLSVPEAAKVLGLGRDLTYRMIAEGRLPAIRFGRLIKVPRAALIEYVEGEALRSVGASA